MREDSYLNQLQQDAINAQSKGELNHASKIYLKILTLEPNHLPAVINLGLISVQLNQIPLAISLFTRGKYLFPAPPHFAQSCLTLAKALKNYGYHAQATEWLRYILTIEPQCTEAQDLIDAIKLPPYLDTYAFDQEEQRWLKRYHPYEKGNFVYAIDIVGTCNLRCPSCPVGNMPNEIKPKGFMTLEVFEQILKKIKKESPSEVPDIWLFNWGEPLLHPQVADFVKLLNDYGWPSMISTNLNIKKGLEELIKSRPTSIKISLSGITDKTYPLTHAKGNVNLLKENLYQLKYLMKQHQSDGKPMTHIYAGFHLYKNNLSEAKQMREICEELGFGYTENAAIIQPVEKMMEILEDKPEPIDKTLIDNLLVHPKKLTWEIKTKRSGAYDCELRFNMMSINYDGSVGLCCSTYAQSNQLADNFLDHSHEDLQAMKYQQSFCKKCRGMNLDYSLCDVVT